MGVDCHRAPTTSGRGTYTAWPRPGDGARGHLDTFRGGTAIAAQPH
jgi:hypothetical protein